MPYRLPKPPAGPLVYIDKCFPKYTNPNWWQKIANWLFVLKGD